MLRRGSIQAGTAEAFQAISLSHRPACHKGPQSIEINFTKMKDPEDGKTVLAFCSLQTRFAAQRVLNGMRSARNAVAGKARHRYQLVL